MTPEQYVQTKLIKEAVVGHELAVLEAMGIGWQSGPGHIDCPYPDHGGEDDWRWDDDTKRAICTCKSWHSIFDVVSTCKGIDFEAAKILVAEIMGRSDLIQKRNNGPRYQKTDAGSLLLAPAENRDDMLPRNYLAFRLGREAASVLMPRTRAIGIKALAYFDPPTVAGGKPKLVGTFPCAVFETIDAMGCTHAQRIYLAPDGQGKADLGAHRDPKKSARVADGDSSTAGRSVIWGDPTTAPHIIVCEGIETGAAVTMAMREEVEAGTVVVAAAISAGGIEAFRPWPATKHITVAADRDEKGSPIKPASQRGEKAARKLGITQYNHIPVAIALPGAAGEKIDWLDVFQRDGAEAVRIGMAEAEPFVPTVNELEDTVIHKADAAELEEIAAVYPLPMLGGTHLCYQHMPDGDVWVHKIIKNKAGGETAIPVFSPVGVVAMLRYADQEGAYGLRVAVQDMGGETRLVDFDRADLARMNAAEIKATFFQAGLRVEADGENIVVALLKAAKPVRTVLVVSRTGWHRLGTASPIFVAPSGEVIGLPEGQDLELSTSAQLRVPATAGSLDDWYAAVETVISGEGCPHWLIGIIAGFVGPILGLTGLDACGINLSGMSTAGKTTAQRLAVSAWSSTKVGDGLLQSMRATENAVEGLSQRANGSVLCLDEVSHIDGKVVARLIYSVAGGVGKARMTAKATLKTPYSWNTFAVFSGECSLEEKVCGDGGQWLAGMAVRFPDIDVTGVNRHAEKSVLDAIDTICRNHGHAGPAFVKALIESELHRQPDELREHVNQAARKLAGPGADGALVRAATSFALMLVAGDLAKQLSLLPATMDVGKAVTWAWDRFRASTDAVALNPEDQVIGNINRWLAERWDVTIRHVGASSGTREAIAWYDNDTVYLPAERLREAAGGALKQVEIARLLDKRALLARRADEKRLTVKYIPKHGNVQAYALSRPYFGCSPNIPSDLIYSMQDRRQA